MLTRALHQQVFTPAQLPPAPLSVGSAMALTEHQRHEYAAAVSAWISSQYFPSDRDRQVLTALNALVERNSCALGGTKDLAIVTGANATGKSTMIHHAARAWHRAMVGDQDDPLTMPSWTPPGFYGAAHYQPVVMVSLDGRTTAASFRAAIGQAMDHAPSARVTPARLFWDHGTRILIIDDVHFLVSSPKLALPT